MCSFSKFPHQRLIECALDATTSKNVQEKKEENIQHESYSSSRIRHAAAAPPDRDMQCNLCIARIVSTWLQSSEPINSTVRNVNLLITSDCRCANAHLDECKLLGELGRKSNSSIVQNGTNAHSRHNFSIDYFDWKHSWNHSTMEIHFFRSNQTELIQFMWIFCASHGSYAVPHQGGKKMNDF